MKNEVTFIISVPGNAKHAAFIELNGRFCKNTKLWQGTPVCGNFGHIENLDVNISAHKGF